MKVLLNGVPLKIAFHKLTSNFVGRLSRNVVMTGNVHLNGKKRRLDYGVAVSKFHTNSCLHTV